MVVKKQVNNHNRQRKLIYLALVFFILYRFLFIFITWHGRTVPPEPDDSYGYLYEAKKVFESKKIISHQPASSAVNSFSYPIFNLLLSLVSWLTSFSLEQSFHFNFYLGTVILGLILLNFLKKFIEKESFLIPLSLLFFSLYNGSGYYHGFYWVVPSFYCFLTFILLFNQVFHFKKNWHLFSFLFSVFFILSHPIAIYGVFIFVSFLAILWLLEKKFAKKIYKQIVLISIFCFFAFFLFRFLLPRIVKTSSRNLIGSPYQLISEIHAGEIIAKGIKVTKTPTVAVGVFVIGFPALPIVVQEYFKILFPHPLFIFIFIFGLFILFKERQFKMLSLYSSCLTLVLISTIHPHGYRSLLFLWPITFLLFSYFVFYTFLFFQKKLFILGKYIVLLFVLFFIIITSYYNFHWSKTINQRQNINWDKKCPEALLKNMNDQDVVLYGSKLARAAFLAGGLVSKPAVFIETFNYYHRDFNKFPVKFLVLEKSDKPSNVLSEDKNGVLLRDCGFFDIYKIEDKKTNPLK